MSSDIRTLPWLTAHIMEPWMGLPWIATYPERLSLHDDISSDDEVAGDYPVIHQFDGDDGLKDRAFPMLEEGEVLLLHPKFGTIIMQNADLDFF